MTGLVIVTHGSLAQGFLEAATLIVGPQEQAEVLGLCRSDDPETVRRRLEALIATVGADGDGVLVMTDMFGGTPTNLAQTLLVPGKVEVLAGISLPVLLKFFGRRRQAGLPELASTLRDYGRQGVVLVSELV